MNGVGLKRKNHLKGLRGRAPPFTSCKVGGREEERRIIFFKVDRGSWRGEHFEISILLEHRRGSERKEEARMRSGRKGEERRGMYSNSHPLESFLYFIVREIRGEKGIHSKCQPSRIFFCFSYFISKTQRRREKGILF